MKRVVRTVVSFALVIAILVVIFSCSGIFETAQDEAKRMLGQYSREEFYSSGGFQDYTDYAKYYYEKMPNLETNKYFSPITSSDVEKLKEYIADFERWVDAIPSVKEHYDFDRALIREGNYFYVYDKMGEPIGESAYEQYEDYDVYIFDTVDFVLYYFHNNI